MKKFGLIVLASILYFGGVFSAAHYDAAHYDDEGLAQRRCFWEPAVGLSYQECCQIEEASEVGVNVVELTEAMLWTLHNDKLQEFRSFLKDERFIRKFNKELAVGLWEFSDSDFLVALLGCNVIVRLLGTDKLGAGLCVAAGGSGDLMVVKAMLSSECALRLLRQDDIRAAFIIAAGFGHEKIVKYFLETQTRYFNFARFIGEQTARAAVKVAVTNQNIDVLELILSFTYIRDLLDRETAKIVYEALDDFVKNVARKQSALSPCWWPFGR